MGKTATKKGSGKKKAVEVNSDKGSDEEWIAVNEIMNDVDMDRCGDEAEDSDVKTAIKSKRRAPRPPKAKQTPEEGAALNVAYEGRCREHLKICSTMERPDLEIWRPALKQLAAPGYKPRPTTYTAARMVHGDRELMKIYGCIRCARKKVPCQLTAGRCVLCETDDYVCVTFTKEDLEDIGQKPKVTGPLGIWFNS